MRLSERWSIAEEQTLFLGIVEGQSLPYIAYDTVNSINTTVLPNISSADISFQFRFVRLGSNFCVTWR